MARRKNVTSTDTKAGTTPRRKVLRRRHPHEEPLTREDLHEAVFQFLEMAAAVDNQLARSGAWPTSEGPRKSAVTAPLQRFEAAVRAMLDVRRGLQVTAVTARAMVAAKAILHEWKVRREVTPDRIREIWDASCHQPLTERAIRYLCKVFAPRKKDGQRVTERRDEAVVRIIADSIGRSRNTLLKHELTSGINQDFVQDVGRFPLFQGREIEVFFRNSPEAFAFVLSQIFGWPTTARSRGELLLRYKSWFEPWQRRIAGLRYQRAMRAGANQTQAEEAANDVYRRFRMPPSPVPEPSPSVQGFTWPKREVEIVTRGDLQLPTTIAAPTRYLPPKPDLLFRKRRVLEAFGSMARRGGLPANGELDQASAALEKWLTSAPQAVRVTQDGSDSVVLYPKAIQADGVPMVRWQRDGELYFEGFIGVEAGMDGALTLLQPKERSVVLSLASGEEVERALDDDLASYPRRYQIWWDPLARAPKLFTPFQAAEAMEAATLPVQTRMLCEFDAETFEEATAIFYVRMGLGGYTPSGTPSRCPHCGAVYYPMESGDCWYCHGR